MSESEKVKERKKKRVRKKEGARETIIQHACTHTWCTLMYIKDTVLFIPL